MTAAAQAVDGVYNNAAAPAVREPFSVNWAEVDPSVGLSLPGAYGDTDFNNRGQNGDPRATERTNRFLAVNTGIQVQLGPLGFTVVGDFLNYDVSSARGTPVSLTIGRLHAVAAYSFIDNQLIVGAGARIAFVNIAEQTTGATGARVRMLGAAPQVGAIVKPNDVPWRLGATVRAAVEASPLSVDSAADDVTGVKRAGPYVLPRTITQPWELEVGAAYQLGPRPLNPRWLNPHVQLRELTAAIEEARRDRAGQRQSALARLAGAASDEDRAACLEALDTLVREDAEARSREGEALTDAGSRLRAQRKARYLNWPREHLLLLASVLFTGASDDAVALEGFIDQRRELVGRSVSASPRFGIEAEPIPHRVRGRAGLYYEPSRFPDGRHRQHFTFGADVRLFAWDIFGLVPQTTWRLSAFFDLAPRYQNFGIAFGPWH